MYSKSLGSTLNLRAKFFNREEEPILHNIALHMERMSFRLTEKKNNILNSFIFNNPAFFMVGKIEYFLTRPFLTNKIFTRTGTK